MDEEAWNDAAVLSGMTHQPRYGDNHEFIGEGKLSEVEDRIYLLYDDDYLYVGYENPAPKEIRGNAPMVAAMMKCSKTGFDTDVEADDSLHIRARNPYPEGDDYRMWVNYLNTHYDWTCGHALTTPVEGAKLAGIDINWNPPGNEVFFEHGWLASRCRHSAQGFHDHASRRAGVEWRMNFARYWRTTLTGITSWESATAGWKMASWSLAVDWAGYGSGRART